MKRECLKCGAKFDPKYPASTQQWCSRACARDGRSVVNAQPWSDFEIGELEGLAHLTAREAGRALGRSMQSVQHMRNKLRAGWYFERLPWDDDELDFVRRTPHLTAEQVANHLGTRTVAAVNHARGTLRRSEGVNFGLGGSHKNPMDVGNRRLLAKTCIGCGLLLDASWFNKANGQKWASRCVRCIQRSVKTGEKYDGRSGYRKDGGASARKSASELQRLTRERATRHGFPWLDADHVILRNSTLTVFEKAIQLGRTWSATHTAVRQNGYTSRVGKGDPLHGVWHIDNPNEAKVAAA